MNGKYQGEPQRTSVVLPYSRIAEILHLFRFRHVPGCPPAPAPKPVCRQFSRCEGCPYPVMAGDRIMGLSATPFPVQKG